MRKVPTAKFEKGPFQATIEGNVSRFTGQLEYALHIVRVEGQGLMDWSTLHFSTSSDRRTLNRRLLKIFGAKTLKEIKK